MRDEFVDLDILDNRNVIVPVVCDDMFEYIPSENGPICSIKDFVSEKYLPRIDASIRIDVNNAIQTNYYYGISLLEQKLRNIGNALYNHLNEAITNGQIRLKECVKHFLRQGDFPLIITTFGFRLIEEALQESANDKKHIVEEWYKPNTRNDLPLHTDESTVVYHIFGGLSSSSWVYNEPTLLKFMHALHSGDYGAKNLSNYLCDNRQGELKRLLVLGSILPDWLFRFLVYPMYEEQLPNTFGYWLSLDSIEEGLELFLMRNNYRGQTELRKSNGMEHILHNATPQSKQTEPSRPRKKPNIFVSYKRSKDKSEEKVLERVISILQKQGNVWIDTENVSDGGNPYWANIKNAVADCGLFVPIVTQSYLNEYQASEVPESWEVFIRNAPYVKAEKDKSNDSESVRALPPVARETYYALALQKRCCPIVIYDTESKLDAKEVEHIAMHRKNGCSLPPDIFVGKNILVHDDNQPAIFNLPSIN